MVTYVAGYTIYALACIPNVIHSQEYRPTLARCGLSRKQHAGRRLLFLLL